MTTAPSMGALSRLSIVKTELLSRPLYTRRCFPFFAAVTKEWLDEIAGKFDARPADIYSEKGYTVVNVHPWTVDMEALDYFVSRLDKHIIKIVTAGELVSLVKEYVRKK